MKHRLLAYLLGGLAAMPAQALSLLDAYMAARQYDPEYRAAWQARQAGVQEERIARSQLLPQASLSYGYNRNWLHQRVESPTTGDTQTFSNSNYPSYAGRVELRQPVVNMQAWAGYRQGQALSEYAEAEFDNRHQQLMLRLYEAYSSALLARDQLDIADAQRVAYAEQMRANDRMFKAGEGTRTEMIETRSRYDVAEAQVLEARNELGNALRLLQAMIGPGHIERVDQLERLTPKFTAAPLQPPDLERWIQLGLSSNTEIIAARLNVAAADADVDRNRAGHYPSVDLVAAYSINEADSVTTINQRNRSHMVGVQVRLPLFSGGGTSARTTQAAANFGRAQAELDSVRNAVVVQLRQQYALIESSVIKIKALESAVASAELLVEATRKSVMAGTRVNLDVLNAEQQLFTTRRDLAQARYDYLDAYMRLRYFAGVLTIDDLETVSTYFSPAHRADATKPSPTARPLNVSSR